MHSFKVTREIPHDATTVWALFENFADIWIYNPNIRHSESINGQASGLGAERLCVMYNDTEVQERVTEYDADAMRYRVAVTDFGAFPMTMNEFDIRVEATETGSRVLIEGEFTPKYGAVGWLLAKTIMVSQFEKAIDKIIVGADNHLSSGRIVGKGGALGELVAA